MSPTGELRVLPIDAGDLVLTHPGYDTQRASEDPEVVFPLQTLQLLAAEGFIGSVAAISISTMGFIPDGRRVIEKLVPAVVTELTKEGIDLALLVPA
jgi:D-proline reductase (dithiol) PrdB